MFHRIPSLTAALVTLLLAACAGAPNATAKDDADLMAPAATRVISAFDASKGELPEGLVIRGGNAFVGYAPTGEIVRVDLAGGGVTPFGSVPKPVPNLGFLTGLEVDSDSSVLAALVSFSRDVQPGIYRVPATGGAATLFAKHADMAFPNGLVWDGAGKLFVTDSAAGAVFAITPTGEAVKWTSDAWLKGDKDYCGRGIGAAFDIGANGIVLRDGAFYVANSDKAAIVKIPILADGTAGTAEPFVSPDCEALGGADGLALAPNGDIVVADNRQDKLVRVTPEGVVHVVSTGAPLDFPASVAFAGSSLVTTSFALNRASTGGQAEPALVALPFRVR